MTDVSTVEMAMSVSSALVVPRQQAPQYVSRARGPGGRGGGGGAEGEEVLVMPSLSASGLLSR
jgi:hypothetical protein